METYTLSKEVTGRTEDFVDFLKSLSSMNVVDKKKRMATPDWHPTKKRPKRKSRK